MSQNQISVVIPAYNEAEYLPQTLASLRRAIDGCDSEVEVIVVDNNSNDGTAEVAAPLVDRVVYEAHNQISRARNAGAAVACGQFLIFLDADTLLDTDLLQATVAAMRGGLICAGGTTLRLDRRQILGDAITAAWNLVSRYFGLAAGCYVFCTREAFDAVGGFSEKVYASEEIWFCRDIKRWAKRRGMRVRVLDGKIVTSARKLDWLSGMQMLKQAAVFLLFPFAVRSKRWCRAWYRRPNTEL